MHIRKYSYLSILNAVKLSTEQMPETLWKTKQNRLRILIHRMDTGLKLKCVLNSVQEWVGVSRVRRNVPTHSESTPSRFFVGVDSNGQFLAILRANLPNYSSN